MSHPVDAPRAPTVIPVGTPSGVTVAITGTPRRFAPGAEHCAIAYRITGTATAAHLEVANRAGTVVARVDGLPHATGANTYSWDGRYTGAGSTDWALPQDSPLQVKVRADPGAVSPAAAVAVQVASLAVTDTPADAAHPERLMRPASGDPEVELTATVQIYKTDGSTVAAQSKVGVDWTYVASSTNCPRANGGKGDEDQHFAPAPGFPDTPGGNAFAWNWSDAHGQSKVRFRASQIAGDKFQMVARVLADPRARSGAVLASAQGRRYEVWRQFTYSNFFQIPSGVNLDQATAQASVQTVFTPAFTIFNRSGSIGQVSNASLTGPYLAPLLAPTTAELPALSRVRVHSDGPDTRTVTIRGKVRATNAAGEVTGTRDDSETLTLNGTNVVTGTKYFQYVETAAISAAAQRTVMVETVDGAQTGSQVGFLGHGATQNLAQTTFEDFTAVQTKAQAWVDRNWAGIQSALTSLANATASSNCLVGGRYLHPKHDGRSARTTFYVGYEDLQIQAMASVNYEPDAQWMQYLGWNTGTGGLSILFLGGASGHALTVARHEIAHASDHQHFGNGTGARRDHCAQSSCLMKETDGEGGFCTAGTDHSLHQLMGWSLP
jgi:hypothetical protein